MDAQLSTMLTIALARALEARPVGAALTPRVGVPGATEQPAWVSPRVAPVVPRGLEAVRSSSADESLAVETAASAEAFIGGTLDMVAYGRQQADALVEYPADRDTVP